jgi:hypothetical protein
LILKLIANSAEKSWSEMAGVANPADASWVFQSTKFSREADWAMTQPRT